MVVDRELIREIKSRADIVSVISEYLPLKRQGKEYVGLCPFHGEDTPSFSVSPEMGLFYCFGCQAGGDVFQFLMRRDNLTFPEAAQRLADKVGVSLPSRELTPDEQRALRRREVLYAVCERAAVLFQACLRGPEGEAAREYLGGRGVAADVGERFRLGYAHGHGQVSVVRKLIAEGFPSQALAVVGLLRQGDRRDWFYGRLIFPICDPGGRVIAFGGRALETGQMPKYLNSPDTELFDKRKNWYGLSVARQNIRREGRALVVEGYMDVITSHQFGFTTAVASMGTSLTPEQVRLLSAQAKEVFLAFDADLAGQKATRKGMELFAGTGVTVRVAPVPEGKDPDEFLRQRGREAMEEVLAKAPPLLDFLLAEAAVAGRGADLGKRAALARNLLPFLRGLADPLEREGYAQSLARTLQLPVESVWGQTRQGKFAPVMRDKLHNSGDIEHISQRNRHNTRDNLTFKAEYALITLLLRSPEGRKILFPRLATVPRSSRREAAPNHQNGGNGETQTCLFSDPRFQEIARAVEELAAEGEQIGPGEVLSRITDPETADLVTGVFMEGILPPDTARALEDCLVTLEEERLRKRREEILRSISEEEMRGERVDHLLRELMELKPAIRVGKEGLR